MCPECGSDSVHVHPYDHGICQETGYHDAGERYVCGEGIIAKKRIGI
jgi:hypothetical protein